MKRSKESENKALYQQLIKLEKDWASLKRSNKPLNFPQISAKSDTSSTATTLDFFKLLEKSPRSLMSSLQNSKSPLQEEGVKWKVKKKNDLVVEEIIRDRKAALGSGKLKGRRLFGEISDEKSSITTSQEVISEDEICSHCVVLRKQMDDNKNNEIVGDDSLIFCLSLEIRVIEGNQRASVNLLEQKSWRYRNCLWWPVIAIFAITISAFIQGICLGKEVEEVIPLPT
ncbi:unnamed protein product [Withania somnifera]